MTGNKISQGSPPPAIFPFPHCCCHHSSIQAMNQLPPLTLTTLPEELPLHPMVEPVYDVLLNLWTPTPLLTPPNTPPPQLLDLPTVTIPSVTYSTPLTDEEMAQNVMNTNPLLLICHLKNLLGIMDDTMLPPLQPILVNIFHIQYQAFCIWATIFMAYNSETQQEWNEDAAFRKRIFLEIAEAHIQEGMGLIELQFPSLGVYWTSRATHSYWLWTQSLLETVEDCWIPEFEVPIAHLPMHAEWLGLHQGPMHTNPCFLAMMQLFDNEDYVYWITPSTPHHQMNIVD